MFDPTTFTGFHTWLSLIALAAGMVVTGGLIGARNLRLWTALFLVTAVGTTVTGFGFPFTGILPSHVLGAVSLVVLAVTMLARYGFHLSGAWRWIYAVGGVTAVYLLAFVAVAQAFQKVPALRALAPTASEAPFAVTEGLMLGVFAALAVAAARTFRPAVAVASPLPA